MPTREDNRVFVDTNVFLAVTARDRKEHQEAVEFMDQGLRGEVRLFATGQIFREYLVVATRPPEVNGMGLSPEEAVMNMTCFQKAVQFLPEEHESARQLAEFVKKYDLKGKRIHDANLVACMFSNGLRRIKTFNPQDFQGFPDLELV
jgi:predicted nucleic acid-binding protein